MGILKKTVLTALAVAGAMALNKEQKKPSAKAKRAVGKVRRTAGKARRTAKRVARKGARRIDRTVKEAQREAAA
jgi:hypothetical protein